MWGMAHNRVNSGQFWSYFKLMKIVRVWEVDAGWRRWYCVCGTELVRDSDPMLKLTKKADYGLISLKHLALHGRQRPASAKEMSELYRIPVPILSKVLQKLVRDGFLVSEQGTNGGYRLTRDPATITALEVIRSIDGPIILTTCFTEQGECDLSTQCTVREPLRRVHEGILKLLDSITISDLSADDEAPAAAGVPAAMFPLHVLTS